MPPSTTLVSKTKCTIFPDRKSDIQSLKLSVSDIPFPMLSCQYIQKGVLFTSPPFSFHHLLILLQQSLSATLSHFPPLAARLATDSHGHVHIVCNDDGIDFLVAKAPQLSIKQVLPPGEDVPNCVKEFFAYDNTISYSGHSMPLAAVQVTELMDGVFIGCTVNHAVTDGTSFWHFFNTLAEISKGASKISKSPDFCRKTVFNSVLKFPHGEPTVTFATYEPLRERILHFSREAILKLKYRANYVALCSAMEVGDARQEIGAHQDDDIQDGGELPTQAAPKAGANEPYYFGNAIQSIPTYAEAGELLAKDLSWGADLLHKNVVAHDDGTVRRGVAEWEEQPRLFPLGNLDGASIAMGSSPRFPMYDNDFGWGRPLAVRSSRANKFEGKISALPGREGDGSVDLEVVLAAETMAGLEKDVEIMQYVCEYSHMQRS
ncbi:hypothetical protein V6N13_137426 [Hibiscus sabdariffa]|uniref:BAHD acyltransferase DCR n=1 Tax=Hibiscus sabdariffa TaxID=183260 RepID=A0ABR2DLL0_9ROSI